MQFSRSSPAPRACAACASSVASRSRPSLPPCTAHHLVPKLQLARTEGGTLLCGIPNACLDCHPAKHTSMAYISAAATTHSLGKQRPGKPTKPYACCLNRPDMPSSCPHASNVPDSALSSPHLESGSYGLMRPTGIWSVAKWRPRMPRSPARVKKPILSDSELKVL